jgi:hypothetical protein
LELISSFSPLQEWKNIDLQNIEPFTLVLFENQKLYQLHWIQIKVIFGLLPPYIQKKSGKKEPIGFLLFSIQSPKLMKKNCSTFIAILRKKTLNMAWLSIEMIL